jgi:hypothetical protein
MIKEALEILAQEPKDEDEDDVPDGNDYEEVCIRQRALYIAGVKTSKIYEGRKLEQRHFILDLR